MKGNISSGKIPGYRNVLEFFGQIILNKILEAASDSKTRFYLIEKTVRIVLESSISICGENILTFYKGFKENIRQHLCDFRIFPVRIPDKLFDV